MKKTVPRLICLLLLVPALSGPGCTASAPRRRLPLARGLNWGLALDGYPITPGRMRETEQEAGLQPDILVFFLAWPERGDAAGEFPAASLDAIRAAGALPCLTWEPMYLKNGEETVIPAEAILAGEFEVFLTEFARAAARWENPFIIRFAHEMNLSRYHWGVAAEDYGPASPQLYRRMFRHIVERFREEGAENVFWAFSPNAESVPREGWNTMAAYYPGDEAVDILGIDGYNWGATRTAELHGWDSRWQDFSEIFARAYGELRGINATKPLIIFETASPGPQGRQGGWLRDALETSRKWGLAGIVWFQADKENDWRLQPDSVRELKTFFAGRGPGGKKEAP